MSYLFRQNFKALIVLLVMMSTFVASVSHAQHYEIDIKQVETLDCKLCQHNLDDNKTELSVNEQVTTQFFIKSPCKESFVQRFQFYVIPALRAPPTN